MLGHLAALCQAVDLPINADFESGFADAPEGVAANVGLAIASGIAGLSIEDRIVGGVGLYEKALAVERIRAARAAINRAGADVILVARTEGLLFDAMALTPAIDRLVAFAEAGADCLFAPGVKSRDDIAAMVRAVAPKPLNVVMSSPGLCVAELADLGVRRISVGGALARVAWRAVRRAAEEMRRGSFDGLREALSSKEMNALFSGKPN
jgi:2-methylisocitrate lyase-like PEP mutase family enzyme